MKWATRTLSSDYERAFELKDHRRLKELELLCDAIAIMTLQPGIDPSRLISGVEKIERYDQGLSGSRVDRTNYPTLSERRAFAREVTKWAAASTRRCATLVSPRRLLLPLHLLHADILPLGARGLRTNRGRARGSEFPIVLDLLTEAC